MKSLKTSQKSRIPILLFMDSFTSLPGALQFPALTTGDYPLNNYALPITNCNWETRLYLPTISVTSGQDYCTLPIQNDELSEAGIPASENMKNNIHTSIHNTIHPFNTESINNRIMC